MLSKAYSNMDYEKVIDFLDEVYALNKNQHSWLPARWEYAEYFANPLYTWLGYKNWTSSIRLWMNDDYEIIGVIGSENPDEQAFIQIHPEYRHIEEEMIEWAEENIAAGTADGSRRLIVYCHDGDACREDILKKRGYERTEEFEHLKWQRLDKEIGGIELPEGYSVHSFEEPTRLEQKILCISKAFHPESEISEEDIDSSDLDLYGGIANAPMYRKDLDIYTKYKDGTMTSTALLWYDPVSKTGMFEPVATHPNHQRKGLGRALLIEGLRRLKALGAETAYVGARGKHKSDFYSSAGFVEFDTYREWKKIIE